MRIAGVAVIQSHRSPAGQLLQLDGSSAIHVPRWGKADPSRSHHWCALSLSWVCFQLKTSGDPLLLLAPALVLLGIKGRIWAFSPFECILSASSVPLFHFLPREDKCGGEGRSREAPRSEVSKRHVCFHALGLTDVGRVVSRGDSLLLSAKQQCTVVGGRGVELQARLKGTIDISHIWYLFGILNS